MNRIQQAEFDILKVFTDVCDKLGIGYYLSSGSALGAIKYGGFIPWDDDVDVDLLREDYEIFLREAPSLLPGNLFLQTYKSDPMFPGVYAKLRNSDTTFIESGAGHLRINHGIYIDIFPLDGYPKSRAAQKYLETKKLLYKAKNSAMYSGVSKGSFGAAVKLYRLIYRRRGIARSAESFEKLIKKYGCADSELLCSHGNRMGRLDYIPKSIYGEGAFAEFEGLRVRVPEDFDSYLTRKYGDYRQDPPAEQCVSHHKFDKIDTERPYTDYI